VDIVYQVEEGPYVVMDQSYFTGNFRTKKKIIQNEIGVKQGEPFSMVSLLGGQRDIRNMDIFNSVQFKAIGLKEKSSTVNLFTEIEEKKPYYMQLGLGYESDTGAYANVRLGDHNLFGANKDAWISSEISQIGYEVKAGIKEPRFLGKKVSAALDLYGERKEEFNQNFGTKKIGSTLGFSKSLTRQISGQLGFRFEQRQQFRLDNWTPTPGVDDNDQFEPRTILAATPSVVYDTRDYFLRPRKGVYSSVTVDVSKGLDNTLDDFIKTRFDLRYYRSPLSRLTFALLGRFGNITSYSSDEAVPDDQLFFLGGTSSVRGFDENLLRFDVLGNPVGGRTALVGSLEARIDMGGNFETALFYDIGRLSNMAAPAVSDDFRSSIGAGLRYITAVGPIGILYGHKLDREEGESKGRWHFSIGYTF
jgi:outer membrane protein insertion porin family